MRTAEAFWSRVDHGDGCWEWQGAIGGRGYGQVNWCGKYKIASRLAWELTHGEIPAGLLVCHRCDNPPCVNPAHLFLGTVRDNAVDMARKGRAPQMRGSLCGKARLADTDIVLIKRRLAAGEPQRSIAADFGVSPSHISRINTGQRWPHGAELAGVARRAA